VIQAVESVRRQVVVECSQINAQWTYDVGLVTHVDLRFVAEGPRRTRVELEHRDLDRYGADADRMRQVFEAPDAWDATLAEFAAQVQTPA
jgi:hypothetical protein